MKPRIPASVRHRWRPLVLVLAAVAASGPPLATAQTSGSAGGVNAPVVVVTATRESVPLVKTPASVGVVADREIAFVRPVHPSQILAQVPGWQWP